MGEGNTVELQRRQRLQEIGLTENQSKVYLALLELGRSHAAPLAKLAQIPRNKAYTVIDELAEKGLVEIFLEDPILVAARPIDNYVRTLVGELEAEQAHLRELAIGLDDEFPVGSSLQAHELSTGRFRVYGGRKTGIQQLKRLIKQAAATLTIVGSAGLARRLVVMNEPFPDDVDVEIMLPTDTADAAESSDLKGLEGATVRTSRKVEGPLVIAMRDEREVLVAQCVPDDASVTSGEDRAFVSDNPLVIQLVMTTIRFIRDDASLPTES